jgi:uracil-DNA glycosylase family protein
MPIVTLAHAHDFAGWRNAARALALKGVLPEAVEWRVEDGAPAAATPPPGDHVFHVPRAFVDLARDAICHDDPERFALLYALLVRLRSHRQALDDRAGPEVARLRTLAAEVRGKKAGQPALSEPMKTRATIGGNLRAAWETAREEAMHCTRCHLYKCATQTVFGEGPLDARILFVGEQPGDQEDLAGRPFVGPAGQLFDRALGDAGLDRSATYVTNAVKHFKFERRGKRRIHAKPDAGEIEACRWWLEQERLLVRPPLTVALGATAARSVFNRIVTIGAMRGRAHPLPEGGEAWVTVHPSFLLRVRDDREREYARFVEDLRTIGKRAKALA